MVNAGKRETPLFIGSHLHPGSDDLGVDEAHPVSLSVINDEKSLADADLGACQAHSVRLIHCLEHGVHEHSEGAVKLSNLNGGCVEHLITESVNIQHI